MFRNQIILTKTNMTCNKLKNKTCFLEPDMSDLELANLKGRVSSVQSTIVL
jgi:hypothetical protein